MFKTMTCYFEIRCLDVIAFLIEIGYKEHDVCIIQGQCLLHIKVSQLASRIIIDPLDAFLKSLFFT